MIIKKILKSTVSVVGILLGCLMLVNDVFKPADSSLSDAGKAGGIAGQAVLGILSATFIALGVVYLYRAYLKPSIKPTPNVNELSEKN